MADGNSVHEKITRLFSIKRLQPVPNELSNEEKTNRLLYLLALSLCLVSFLATAEGLAANVFVGHPVRAYIVSLVVQAIIFFFSVRIGRRANKGIKWWAKILIALVYFGALTVSVVFDYAFICNAAYSFNHEGVQGNDVYLSNEYNVALSDAERYAKKIGNELEEDLDPLFDEIKAAVGDGVVVVSVPSISDPEAASQRTELESLVSRHASTDELNEYVAGLSALCSQLEISIAEQNELVNQYRSTINYLNAYGGDVQTTITKMEDALAEVQRLSDLRSYYQSLIGVANSAKGTAGYQTTSSFDDLVAQIESPDPDSAAISESLHAMASAIVASRGEGDSLADNLGLVHKLNRIADEYGDVGEMNELLDECRNYRALMPTMNAQGVTITQSNVNSDAPPDDGNGGDESESVSDEGEPVAEPGIEEKPSEDHQPEETESTDSDNEQQVEDVPAADTNITTLAVSYGSEFDEQKWAEKWTGALSLLRSALVSAPLSEDGSVEHEVDELIAKVDELEHDRLGYMSPLEQAVQYIAPGEYPYPLLARLCLGIALFLDLGSLGIGIFANVRNRRD